MSTTADFEGLKGYPNQMLGNDDKGRDYHLQYVKSAFQSWSTGGAGGFYADRSRKLEAQSYRLGMQDPAKVMNVLNLKGEITEVNVNYDPLPIVQKFADLVVNNIMNENYKLKLEFSDNIAVEKKDQFRNGLKQKMLSQPIAELLTQVLGVDYKDKDVPENEEDIELMLEVDYRDIDEISLLALINSVRNTNGFDEIARELVDDLVSYKEAATYTYIDEKEGIVQEYVPNLNFIRSTSKEKSNKNIQHAGEIKSITLGELRKMIRPQDNISDEELNEIAKGLATKTGGYGNVDWDDPIYADRLYGSSRWYDELDVEIVRMEWMDVDYNLYEKKQTSLGLPVMHKRPKDYRLPQNSLYEREIFTDTFQTVRKGTWIQGTDHVIQWGRADNILLQGKDLSKARLNYSIYTIQGKSLVETMIPYADQMWIAHIKIQHLIAKLRPSGSHINVSALEDALKSTETDYYEPIDLMNLYDITGNLLYRDDTEEEGLPRRGVPVGPMPNAIGSQLNEMVTIYNQNLEIIRDMTNVSKFMDGSQVSSKTLVGVQEKGIEQSNMGIDHFKAAYEFLVKDSTKVAIMCIQDVFRYPGLTKAYEEAIGKYSMDTIKRFKSIPIEQLNIFIGYGLTTKEAEVRDADLNASVSSGELRVEDAIMIREIDDIRLSNKMMIKRRKVYAKEKQAEQEQLHKQAMEQEQAKIEARQAEIQAEATAKANAEIMVMQKKLELEAEANVQIHADAMALQELDNKGKLDVANIQNTGQLERMGYTEKKKDDRIKDTKSAESRIANQKENNEGPIDFKAPEQVDAATV